MKTFEFESQEQYFGDPETVAKKIEECPHCGGKMSFGHLADFKNLLIQETAYCHECDFGTKKVFHVIN